VGSKARATSPTFTLAREYRGRLTLHHVDLFRLSPADLDGIGLDDYLSDPRAATAVEWADVAGGRLPFDRLDVRLEAAGVGRKLTLEARGPSARRLLA
jgi:tRNA threonylcarbamoyl adenosine modification protein YjeE